MNKSVLGAKPRAHAHPLDSWTGVPFEAGGPDSTNNVWPMFPVTFADGLPRANVVFRLAQDSHVDPRTSAQFVLHKFGQCNIDDEISAGTVASDYGAAQCHKPAANASIQGKIFALI